VRLIGFAIKHGENALHRPEQTGLVELASGAALTIAVVGSAYSITAAILQFTRRLSRPLGDAAELLLAWTCLAARNLEQEALAVIDALECDNLSPARSRLARIVGRDTEELDAQEISRAVIETVAESASDGILAPLFYLALGGVPLAMAYKAVNTLDSMIGHADSRHFYFGKPAARLDDAANYVPSRTSALAIVAAAQLLDQSDSQAAWQTWRRDGGKHKSPNAGQPESAMAGALRVALGGDNTYAGEAMRAQRMGQEFSPCTPQKAGQALRLVSVASLVGLGFGVALTCLIRVGKRS